MSIVANIAGWIGRHAIVLGLLFGAFVIHGMLPKGGPSVADLQHSVATIEAAKTELRGFIASKQGAASTALGAADRRSDAAIGKRIEAAQFERAARRNAKPKSLDYLTSPKDMIVASVRRDIEIELLTQEIDFLEALRKNLRDRGKAFRDAASLDRQIAEKTRDVARLRVAIAGDERNLAILRTKSRIEQYQRAWPFDLRQVYSDRREGNLGKLRAADAVLTQLRSNRERVRQVAELSDPKVAIPKLETLLKPLGDSVAAQVSVLEATTQRKAQRLWQRYDGDAALAKAFKALLVVMLAPFLIRTLFYYVLAPLAALQRPVRLLESGAPIPLPADGSAVSTRVTLTPDTELLVKPGSLSGASGGDNATRWLLDPALPISSIAAGLYFLTRVRGAGESVTISATRGNPFAEVAMLDLPRGAACVIQPRALVGVVQPINEPMRITRHWRLGTLNAWLTWQLRFLVFHGPAQLILTGGRGVRIEPVQQGHKIAQEQLIGFSAGLSYTTGRTETFMPYLFGRESLLKDRVGEGSGILIAEEAPLAGRGGSGIKHGLEGAFDAFLKVFGI